MKTLPEFERLSIEKLLVKIEVDKEKGLSQEQVTQRIQKYGLNQVSTHVRSHILIEFLKNFANPLVLILLAIVIISFVLGDTLNGVIVLMMLFLSVGLNFYQEHKASNAAEKLQEKVALVSTVIRDSKEQDVKANEIVVGDILVLNAGDLIPADARLLETKDFFVNQSSLTGEAFPVEKSEAEPINQDGEIGSLTHTIFSGTNVVTGTAKAVVIATGVNTEFGKIAKDLSQTEQENNFTHGIKHFSFFILRIVVVFVSFIFAVNAVIKHDFLESLTFAIAVAVGLTPEFLPMIMTVTMGKGALLMAKKGVIVKKLTAIPSFGSMNILCTDKTGTLTEDKISLVEYMDIDGHHSPHVLEMAYLNSSLQTGITNPLDQAVVNYKKLDITAYKKIDEIPFDFIRRRMSVVVEHQEKRLLIAKGAPESLLLQSTRIMHDGKETKFDDERKQQYTAQYEKLSAQGYRVLAVATKVLTEKKAAYSKDDESDLVLTGFAAFLDPVKQNAQLAISELKKIGIEMKVLTGDNEVVTKMVCKEANIDIKGVLLGGEIADMSDQELAKKALNVTIFARFSPNEKERVIRVLKMTGNVVGYMGDGINDSPSIKMADVGISVENAVDVAKESADFILTNKSLLELKDGVIEGRVIFGNTMKYIMMGLSSNFGNMFSVLGAVLFLPFLPMLPIQILLNNFLYDLSQVTIPTDNVDQEYLKAPKRWDIHFIRKFMYIFGPISSLFDFITFFVLYTTFSHFPGAFQTGWFMESLATQTLVIHVIRTQKIPFIESHASKALTFSTILVVILGWTLPYLPIGKVFQLSPLPLQTVLILVGIVAGYLILVEFGKRLFYRLNEQTAFSKETN